MPMACKLPIVFMAQLIYKLHKSSQRATNCKWWLNVKESSLNMACAKPSNNAPQPLQFSGYHRHKLTLWRYYVCPNWIACLIYLNLWISFCIAFFQVINIKWLILGFLEYHTACVNAPVKNVCIQLDKWGHCVHCLDYVVQLCWEVHY